MPVRLALSCQAWSAVESDLTSSLPSSMAAPGARGQEADVAVEVVFNCGADERGGGVGRGGWCSSCRRRTEVDERAAVWGLRVVLPLRLAGRQVVRAHGVDQGGWDRAGPGAEEAVVCADRVSDVLEIDAGGIGEGRPLGGPSGEQLVFVVAGAELSGKAWGRDAQGDSEQGGIGGPEIAVRVAVRRQVGLRGGVGGRGCTLRVRSVSEQIGRPSLLARSSETRTRSLTSRAR